MIEERQRKVLEHARRSRDYAEDLDPHAHDRDTFQLINQRKDLDELPEADYVAPVLDEWKHWTKIEPLIHLRFARRIAWNPPRSKHGADPMKTRRVTNGNPD